MRLWAVGVIAIVLLIFTLHALYGQLVLKNKLQYRSASALDADANLTIDILFLGSSHTLNAAYAPGIPRSYNFASGSNSYPEMYWKYMLVREKNLRPEILVLELDPETLSPSMVAGKPMLEDWWFYRRIVGLDEGSRITGESLGSLYFRGVFPFIGNGNQFFVSSSKTMLVNGWANNTKRANFSDALATNYSLEAILPDAGTVSLLAEEYYTKLLRQARVDGVRVVFIQYPHAAPYYSSNLFNRSRTDFYYERTLDIANMTGVNYTYVDYSRLFVSQPEFFADVHHLNYKGAVSLSNRLYRDIDEP